MKKVRRAVTAAASDEKSDLIQLISFLKDDFDYIITGLEKLDRDGSETSKQGLAIAEALSANLQSAISDISNIF